MQTAWLRLESCDSSQFSVDKQFDLVSPNLSQCYNFPDTWLDSEDQLDLAIEYDCTRDNFAASLFATLNQMFPNGEIKLRMKEIGLLYAENCQQICQCPGDICLEGSKFGCHQFSLTATCNCKPLIALRAQFSQPCKIGQDFCWRFGPCSREHIKILLAPQLDGRELTAPLQAFIDDVCCVPTPPICYPQDFDSFAAAEQVST